MDLDAIYTERFRNVPKARRDAIWREITRYLQRYIANDAAVLDIGCNTGEFIRHVTARERWAADLRDVSAHLPKDVRFVQADGLALADSVPSDYFDVAFLSNYLEHLPSAEAVVDQLVVIRGLLKAGGIAIVLQPNARLVGGAYWDFIDHKVALTERSLREAAAAAALRTAHVITRFLPYTTTNRLASHPLFVRAYLRFRPAWRLMGKQTLFIARRPLNGDTA